MIILVSIILSFFMTQLIEEPIRTSNNDKFSFKRLAIMGSINLALIGALFIGMNLEQKHLEEKIIDKDYPGVMAFYDSVEVPKKKMIPDRKSTRLNSSHVAISYAVFCLQHQPEAHGPRIRADEAVGHHAAEHRHATRGSHRLYDRKDGGSPIVDAGGFAGRDRGGRVGDR